MIYYLIMLNISHREQNYCQDIFIFYELEMYVRLYLFHGMQQTFAFSFIVIWYYYLKLGKLCSSFQLQNFLVELFVMLLWRVFTLIYLKETMFLGNAVLQLFCSYYSPFL